MSLSCEFKPSGRGKARCAPNPEHPDGVDINLANGIASCSLDLPYPAPECGIWIVKCDACKQSIGVTAAGRIDDPKSIEIPCIQ